MKIYLGADHAGFELKEKLRSYLTDLGHDVEDKGAFSFVSGDDYPDFVMPVAESVSSDKESLGIVLGGSGQGEAMVANRVKGVRALVFYGKMAPQKEIDITGATSTDEFAVVKLGRLHDNANILSLGARFVTEEEAINAVKIFLETPFSNEERHARRVSKY
jgi:ribose 5-phosphate isomerase B